MKKLKIGLDFDGVIGDCGKLKSLAGRRLFGVDVPSEQFNKKTVIDGGLLTPGKYDELQIAVFHTWEFCCLMEPVSGAIEGIRTLQTAGHSVRIITSRSNRAIETAEKWLAQHELNLDITGVGYGESKSTAATAAGLEVFIDDDVDKLVPLEGIVPHLFLLSWGYNQQVSVEGLAKRVASWGQFIDEVLPLST